MKIQLAGNPELSEFLTRNPFQPKTISAVQSFHPNEKLMNVFTGIRLIFTDDSAMILTVGTVAPGAEPSLIIVKEDDVKAQD